MKNFNRNKLFATLVLFCSVVFTAQAQFLRTSYFMEGTHYRMQLNPALTPGRGYINLPVVGTLNASVNSSSLGYQDMLDIIDNSDDGDFFMKDDFIKRLSNENNLNVNVSTDIFSAGWYKGKNFWSFNVGVRNDIGASIPKATFEFLRDMNSRDFSSAEGLLGIKHNIGQQKLEVNSYAEVGVGFARDLNEKLTIGTKVKALLGVANMKLNINSIQVETPSVKGQLPSNLDNLASWTPADWNNLLNNATTKAMVKVDAELESSSKLIELQENGNNGYIDDIDTGTFGFAGYGAAIDLGLSYRLTKQLTLSASLLDLGFLKWSKKNTQVAKARANQEYDLMNDQDRNDFIGIVNSGEILNYDMLQMTVDENAAKDRNSKLTSTVVVGAEYALLNNWMVVGALFTSRFAQPKTLNELTFSANIRPKNYFNLSLSYSVLQAKGKTFGVAAKLGPLFIGTDYMFLGKNTKNVNGYIGLSIPLSKQKSSKSEKDS